MRLRLPSPWAVALAVPLLIVAGTVAFIARVESELRRLEGESALLRAEIVRKKAEIPEREQLRDAVAQYLARGYIIDAIDRASVPAAEALADLSRLPRGVAITRLDISGHRLTVAGEIDAPRAPDIAAALAGSAVMRKPQLKASGGAFTLEAELQWPDRR